MNLTYFLPVVGYLISWFLARLHIVL